MTIVLRSLVVRSGGTTLVNGVALRLAPASRTALVGASGAGKSLTCAALAGILPASLEVAGSLTIEPDDADAGSDPRASSAPGGEAGGVQGVLHFFGQVVEVGDDVVEQLLRARGAGLGEEGQGLLDDELDHLPDMLRADGAWVYYAVPAENYFILTWMEDAEKAAAKVNSLKDEDDSLACIVDLTQEWTRTAE